MNHQRKHHDHSEDATHDHESRPTGGHSPESLSAPPSMTEFPTAGSYRLFLQFKHEGDVHTAEFTRDVIE